MCTLLPVNVYWLQWDQNSHQHGLCVLLLSAPHLITQQAGSTKTSLPPLTRSLSASRICTTLGISRNTKPAALVLHNVLTAETSLAKSSGSCCWPLNSLTIVSRSDMAVADVTCATSQVWDKHRDLCCRAVDFAYSAGRGTGSWGSRSTCTKQSAA